MAYVLSAYALIHSLDARRALNRGSMDKLNRNGAKGSPCGTPLDTRREGPIVPLMESDVYQWW